MTAPVPLATSTSSAPTPWLLYGTSECHLCDQAEQLLTQLAQALPIQWQRQDITLLDQSLYARLEQRIPVLFVGTQELQWPFGLTDLYQLAQRTR